MYQTLKNLQTTGIDSMDNSYYYYLSEFFSVINEVHSAMHTVTIHNVMLRTFHVKQHKLQALDCPADQRRYLLTTFRNKMT